ncbi:YeeE/YedE thiosulfate transporter family protein [Octadecabacter sp. 1_MG-2023]|uniref:YeeE/YedE family protein n=1 Tax=unclassified Octadecabacter TaxID=196158 RepID=UPI001C0852F1|nr:MULTISPECIES: YeeE/YedE thiosulfate transporter family protein [unclassified Octadecabacter]MBU2993150.1 YeeE/YedE family protein [Octadecabacter sp. B2R22]MDO6733398.1 YeeE/YedE thiosulfate transporter family protein [Octadecabacter sp. 1_MG-2023]
MIETAFTPFQSLGGGVLIGLASVLLMATVGRIMGATGILAGFMQPSSMSDWSWRAALLAGMVSGPLVVMLVTGSMPAVQVPVSTLMLVVGGFLVGIGVTFGAGCTSGHGVCGMARLSPRSIAATITFMITTAITVYVIRHVLGA